MMTFRREIRVHMLRLCIWAAVLGVLLMTLLLMYPSLQMRQNEIMAALSATPPLAKALGIQAGWLASGMIEYYADTVAGLQLLLVSVFALLVGSTMLCKEQEDGTAEMLLCAPVRRASVVVAKLAATALLIALLDALLVGLCTLILASMREPIAAARILAIFGNLLLSHIELGALALAISSACAARRHARAIALLVGGVLLLLNLFARFDPTYGFLTALTPFSRMALDAAHAAQPLLPVFVAAGVTLAAVAWSIVHFGRKNIAL